VDAQAQVNWLNSDISSSSSGALVTGLNSTAYVLSVEGGHRFALGANTAIVPQAQITWGNNNIDTFTDSVGNTVDLGSNSSLVGRLGMAYEFAITGESQKLYVVGSVLHDFSGDSTVTVAGVTTSAAIANPTSAEIGFGGTTRLGAVELYGEAGVRTALGGSNDLAFGGTFGLSMKF
jgi:fibronectin-binding autotransporter adhesin